MKISIIIPVFNEEESLNQLFSDILNVMRENNFEYEIIFIDDGSTDNSFKILKGLAGSNVKVIKFRRNFGKSAALSAGFNFASGKVVITMDADLQDDPKEIPGLIKKLQEGYDLVSGWKYKRNDPLTKKIPSKIFNFVTCSFMNLKIHDINCGLKAYRQEVIKEMEIYGDLHRFLPVIAHNKGFKVTELQVNHHSRKYGYSKYGFRRFFAGLTDLLTVFLITKYFKKPAHLFGTLGFIFFTVGFLADLYVSLLKFFTGTTQGHIPLLIFGVLMIIVGIQFISFGLLSELIIKLDKKQEYIIDDETILKK
ncbi:glycosyltransferase [Candidatus Parcubacteria bacterium]|nr:MAG: glycosyltransferase [Candidatus Parcubacteria bacterium]